MAKRVLTVVVKNAPQKARRVDFYSMKQARDFMAKLEAKGAKCHLLIREEKA